MFNSRTLLARNGLLGSVWTAAHCLKKLRKKQVLETDIVACVDMILNGGADEVSLRVLCYLLLGVVRVYSKKVEFLNHDFADMLREVNNFIVCRSCHSITLPETFELDAFNLDIPEDQDFSKVHVRSREDITLADNSRAKIYCRNDQYYGLEDTFSHEVSSSASTPVRDVCSPWFMDIDLGTRSPNDINILKPSMERLVGSCLLLGKHLEQKMLGYIEKGPGFDMSSNEGRQTDGEQINHHGVGILKEKSIDKKSMQPMTLGDAQKESSVDMLLDEGQTDGEQISGHDVEINCQELARLEKSIDNESVEPVMLVDAEEEPGFDMPSAKGYQTDGEVVEHPHVIINFQKPVTREELVDNEPSMEKLRHFGLSSVDHLQPIIFGEVEKESHSAMPSKEGHQVLGEQITHSHTIINFEEPEVKRLPGTTSFSNQIQEKGSLSISVNVTPDPRSINSSGAGSSEFIALRTPASMERARVPKKQKCLVDKEVIISNKVLGNQIKDSRRLVRERKKLPFTPLQVWKVQKIGNLLETFLEPLIPIPCKGVDFSSLVSKKISATRLSAETAEIHVNVNPDPKSTGGSGAGSPELIALHTPATEDRSWVLKKRKCLLDEEVIISNEVLQSQIKDSHDLVCERKQFPSTPLEVSEVPNLDNLIETFSEPLIPCKESTTRLSVDTAEVPVNQIIMQSPVTQMSVAPAETTVNLALVESTITQMSVKLAKAPLESMLHESAIRQISSETAEAPLNPIIVESPVTEMSHEQTSQTPTAPTPFTLASSSSFDNGEKHSSLDKDQESDTLFIDEEVNSSASGDAEKCEWSEQTRKAATYLHQNISNLKEREGDDGFLNLSHVMERQTRTKCAKLFYEILALKTGDYINVRQDDAYGDILVQETPKLKQTIDAYGNTSRG